MKKPAKDLSKILWMFDESPIEREAIKIGCMQRIADACELMAKDRARMVADLEHWKKTCEYERSLRWGLEKQLIAKKGQVTRLKRLLNEANSIKETTNET